MTNVTFGDIRNATLAARQRTGDSAIGTRVQKGLFQVVRVTYAKGGKSDVQALSDYLMLAAAVSFLQELGQ